MGVAPFLETKHSSFFVSTSVELTNSQGVRVEVFSRRERHEIVVPLRFDENEVHVAR